MVDVVIIKSLQTQNLYYLSSGTFDLKKRNLVVFEDDNGILIGEVVKEKYKERKENLILPLNKVLRLVTEDDMNKYNENKKNSILAMEDAKGFSKKLGLDMNFVDAYYYLDNSQLVFSFLSDNRVDFRELAKKLASKYKTRIELRQVGVRDKAKRIGGIGPCGLFLCCNTFLTDFSSVSINMAKNQLLALNPAKINGICGRLLCCLAYENDIYTEMKKDLPKIGLIADTSLGMGKVVSVDIFKKSYYVDLNEQGIVEFSKKDDD